MKYVNSVLDLIGNTPMVKLGKVVPENAGNVFVKCEYLNGAEPSSPEEP